MDTQTQPRRAVSAPLDADVTEIHLRAGAGEGVRWRIVVAADDPLVVAARGDRARAMRLVRVSLALVGLAFEALGALGPWSSPPRMAEGDAVAERGRAIIATIVRVLNRRGS